ncbi:hypothetical protein JI666_16825 [Bacillus sp. NTK071]|uniref:hypothetical protein n=1 Tax=Bacillus sp. NTK071 TaxID=2802175 RepID=UPI001A909D0A|nr:hypothetical protein [Bacillus sp. NTK071]MBN8210420.1 hypothetical protein [Bacillus sp. NTK071]
MWFALIIGIIILAFSIVEIPEFRKNKKKKELWTYSILLLIGYPLLVAQIIHVHLANPLDLITFVYKPMSQFLFALLR